jgi:hypothetical protein
MDLRREVERETGIPAELTDTVIHALEGADHLGSLLKVDTAVEEAIDKHEAALGRQEPKQYSLLEQEPDEPPIREARVSRDLAKAGILERLEDFLARHTGGDDLGLRLRGEQLAAGVRFVRMIRQGTYDLVVGNPPYQGTSKMADAEYVRRHYSRAKADLYAAFLERGLQLARDGGASALLTMQSWMFTKQYVDLRTWLLETYDLRALGDFAIGAFDEVANDRLSVVVSAFRKAKRAADRSVAVQPTPVGDRSYDRERTKRKRAAVACQVGRYTFYEQSLQVVPEWPVVYWWSEFELSLYEQFPTFSEFGGALQGISTANNSRFLRFPWEIRKEDLLLVERPVKKSTVRYPWVPYIKVISVRREMGRTARPPATPKNASTGSNAGVRNLRGSSPPSRNARRRDRDRQTPSVRNERPTPATIRIWTTGS